MASQSKVFESFLTRTLSHVNQTRGAFIWAFLTIGLSLFVLTFILVLLFHFRQLLVEVHQKTIATVFLSVSNETEAKQFEEQVQMLSTQIKTKLVSPEKALQKAQANWDEQLDIAFHEQKIKMPWVLIVHSESDDPSLSDFMMRQLKNYKQVEEVISPGVAIKRAQWTLRSLYGLGWLFAFLLAVLVIVVVMNTIRIHVLKHLVEIRVMRLVGATETFVRGPYIVEGFLLGFFGAILAFLLIGIFYFCCFHFADAVFLNDLQWLGFYDTPISIFLSVLIFGSALGAFGSFLILLQDYESEWRSS